MFSTPQSAMQAGPPNSAVIDTAGGRLSDKDDMALGCECADPSLQIERWLQEAVPHPGLQA